MYPHPKRQTDMSPEAYRLHFDDVDACDCSPAAASPTSLLTTIVASTVWHSRSMKSDISKEVAGLLLLYKCMRYVSASHDHVFAFRGVITHPLPLDPPCHPPSNAVIVALLSFRHKVPQKYIVRPIHPHIPSATRPKSGWSCSSLTSAVSPTYYYYSTNVQRRITVFKKRPPGDPLISKAWMEYLKRLQNVLDLKCWYVLCSRHSWVQLFWWVCAADDGDWLHF